MTALSTGESYTYDENGNMTCRVENDNTYVQNFNAENRLSTVLLVSGTCAENGDILAGWGFTYDGNGTRVKQVYTDLTSIVTTYYFAGGSFEVQDDGTTEKTIKYYSFAGGTIMDDGDGVKYFLADHLGSVVAVTNASGALLSEQRYMPFGEVRTGVGVVTETDYGYTGQRNLDSQGNAISIGLMDYNARFYDPGLARFISPDTMVLGGPQAMNRYGYVQNSPINFSDPTGHMPCNEEWGCGDPQTDGGDLIPPPPAPTPTSDPSENSSADPADFGIDIDDEWGDNNEQIIINEIVRISNRLWDAYSTYCRTGGGWLQGCIYTNAKSLFKSIFGGLKINLDPSQTNNACNAITWGAINCGSLARDLSGRNTGLITHEFGHKFDYSIIRLGSTTLGESVLTVNGFIFQPGDPLWRSDKGYQKSDKPFIQHFIDYPPGSGIPDKYYGNSPEEDFGDMFYNWVFQDVYDPFYGRLGFANNDYGDARFQWMNTRMGNWIYLATYP